MTTSTAPLPLTADQILARICTVAATLISHPTCTEDFVWNAGVREFIAELDKELTAADDVCGLCGNAYDVHCKDCYCCPGTHDECCGW